MDETAATPPMTMGDAELAALIRDHPAQGLGVLYDRYGRLVFSVALRITQDHGAAEEITQDVFLRCWRSIERYQPGQGSLSTWIISIAHNRAIDELRSRRGQHLRREVSDSYVHPHTPLDQDIDELLLRSEIQQALRELPAAQRDVIELIFWGGLTRREVAEQLQLPLGTVHTRLRLGIEKLRAALGRLLSSE